MPELESQTKGQAEPVFFQAPVLSHVWGCRPLHCLALAVQAVHVPPLQIIEQMLPVFCQVPVESHV